MTKDLVLSLSALNITLGDKDDCITYPLGKDCEANTISALDLILTKQASATLN